MKPLDSFDRRAAHLEADAQRFLSETEYREFQAIAEEERLEQLRALLEHPIARFTAVNEVYFRARWEEALRALNTDPGLTLLEVASGDADMIPQMMARAYPGSRYITANMNELLTASLREKTRDLPVEVVVIEEDAAEIERFLSAECVDVIAFQHAVNDVMQGILCGQEGIDTIYADWMQILPAMIGLMRREVAEGTLEAHVRPAFTALLTTLLKVLKPGGVAAMNHYMFQLDLDWGYPPELWENIIPLTRAWLQDLPGCEEITLEGFDPHWWLFLRKR